MARTGGGGGGDAAVPTSPDSESAQSAQLEEALCVGSAAPVNIDIACQTCIFSIVLKKLSQHTTKMDLVPSLAQRYHRDEP